LRGLDLNQRPLGYEGISRPQPAAPTAGDALDWLGILAGTAVIVVVLATPLAEPGLVLALAIGLRGAADPRH